MIPRLIDRLGFWHHRTLLRMSGRYRIYIRHLGCQTYPHCDLMGCLPHHQGQG